MTRQRGIAAIEMALLLPVLASLLAVALYFGRFFWHYTAAQKAVHNAAIFLSTIPPGDMKDLTRIAYATAMANTLVSQELAELHPGEAPVFTTVLCDYQLCNGLALPAEVRVSVQMRIDDIFLPAASQTLYDPTGGILITANATLPYVGN